MEPEHSTYQAAPTGPRRLGDLLYADRTKPVVPEQEWVALVDAIAAGDQAALRELYLQTHRLVFTLIVRITNSREAAEELTLDVFHDIWRRASSYDLAAGTVIGWIMNQARSRAIDRLRLAGRRKRVNRCPDDDVPQTITPEPHEVLLVSQQSRLLRNALTLLTPDERRAIETAYFSELSYAETAASLDEPVGTIKTRIRSGLAKLRDKLDGMAKVL